ncbi:general stress protein [Bhargavaea cecembensis]|uniref:General stress protein n=1 Tax=Bhargavaea cecembensis TaxID=394098 RepID=A0A161SLC4_9BACL|nr:general stress protein [Bhargavaea cecembensis]KZE38403.1 general stress protein [Bhargavaea cecembensis]
MTERRVVGYYDNEQQAIDAIEDLKRQGYTTEDISVISKNNDDVEAIQDETGTQAAEGAATGAATGGVLGGLGGVLAGLGALAIPGIGPIVAAGPVVAGLTGAAAGAGVGGLAGALIGMGVPEDEAERYETYFNEGKILVLVDRNASVEDTYFTMDRDRVGETAATTDRTRMDDTVDPASRDRFNDPL